MSIPIHYIDSMPTGFLKLLNLIWPCWSQTWSYRIFRHMMVPSISITRPCIDLEYSKYLDNFANTHLLNIVKNFADQVFVHYAHDVSAFSKIRKRNKPLMTKIAFRPFIFYKRNNSIFNEKKLICELNTIRVWWFFTVHEYL